MMEYILRTEKLSKSFGKIEVLHDIDFSIQAGEICGLIGQNGAGKTTLLRLISGLMKPTKGNIHLQTGKKLIGYMPQSCRFDDNTTTMDTIRFFARLRNADRMEGLLLGERLNLDISKKVKHLSPGQQKKLQMVVAMIGDPELYILDEPTAGLDPNATYEMKHLIKEIHESGKSIIISSHILQDMDELCTSIAIMKQGRLIYNHGIESSYMFKTSVLTEQIIRMLSESYPISVDERKKTLIAKIKEEQVPQIATLLCNQNICIYGITESGMRNVVEEKLPYEEVQK